jgi:hypothetical protein
VTPRKRPLQTFLGEVEADTSPDGLFNHALYYNVAKALSLRRGHQWTSDFAPLQLQTCWIAALDSVRLLGMECDLLSRQVANQFPGSIDRNLIIDREQNPPISLERLVDFHTLFTHLAAGPFQVAATSPPACFTTILAVFCFIGDAPWGPAGFLGAMGRFDGARTE